MAYIMEHCDCDVHDNWTQINSTGFTETWIPTEILDKTSDLIGLMYTICKLIYNKTIGIVYGITSIKYRNTAVDI